MSTQADYKINDYLSVKGIGGWRGIADQDFADFSSIPYELFEGDNYNNIQESTEELQLVFRNDFLTGTLGFFSYHDDREFRRQNWFDNEWNSPLVNPALNAEVVALLGAQPAAIGLPQNVDQLTYTFTHGTAEYTDWTWLATDKLSVMAGVRFNRDESTTANYNPLHPIPLLCIGFLETAYEDVPPGNGFAAGSPFPYAPKWQNNAALQYDTPLPNGGSVTLRTDYSRQQFVRITELLLCCSQ